MTLKSITRGAAVVAVAALLPVAVWAACGACMAGGDGKAVEVKAEAAKPAPEPEPDYRVKYEAVAAENAALVKERDALTAQAAVLEAKPVEAKVG